MGVASGSNPDTRCSLASTVNGLECLCVPRRVLSCHCRAVTVEKSNEKKRPGQAQVSLTELHKEVLLLPKHDPVCLVHGSFAIALQGEEVEQLGWTELVSPLVGPRTEAMK